MVKHPACAAAISSSGLVPFSFSKRVLNEYGVSASTPESVVRLPLPARPVPRQTAFALRIMSRLLFLILFTESLRVGFAVGVEQLLAALLPRRLEFRRRDVPVRPAFPGNGTEVLAEILHRRPAEKPIAIVDLVNDETWLKHDHMRDHGIVNGIRIFGD